VFRHLILFPSVVDHDVVERIAAEDLATAFRRSDGFRSLSVSVRPLMGPAAREGEISGVVEATFETLDAALAAIMAPSFEETKTKVEALGVRIYLFELRDL
jgi:hypothetical protein